jgi:hypothetical protein
LNRSDAFWESNPLSAQNKFVQQKSKSNKLPIVENSAHENQRGITIIMGPPRSLLLFVSSQRIVPCYSTTRGHRMLLHPNHQAGNDGSKLHYVHSTVVTKRRNENEIICDHSFRIEI